jgi:hypothetical protein
MRIWISLYEIPPHIYRTNFMVSIRSDYLSHSLTIIIKMEERPEQEKTQTWRKKIEMVGIDIKGIDSDDGTEGRIKLKTNLINQHLINELDKIGLQLINIKATFNGKVVVLLEPKV